MRVGIDASNLRQGGGITHLVALLDAARPETHGFTRITVWGGRDTLARLSGRPWLDAVHCPELDGSIVSRLRWQRRALSRLAAASCDVLLAAGGSYSGHFRPVVAMSRNMLPFAPAEARRYGWSYIRLRLALLRWLQARTFRTADGVIFLNETARRAVQAVTGPLRNATAVIPHGVSQRFTHAGKAAARAVATAPAQDAPFRWLYVSIVDVYKHQWHVAEAVARVRAQGLPVTLDLVGPAYPPALRRLERTLQRVDPGGEFIRYHGEVPHAGLVEFYRRCDAFVFASTCENMPNILLEAAAAGLPILSADVPVMRETLGAGAVYADVSEPAVLASVMEAMMRNPAQRARLAAEASSRARDYTWERCADATFAFLREVAAAHRPRAAQGSG